MRIFIIFIFFNFDMLPLSWVSKQLSKSAVFSYKFWLWLWIYSKSCLTFWTISWNSGATSISIFFLKTNIFSFSLTAFITKDLNSSGRSVLTLIDNKDWLTYRDFRAILFPEVCLPFWTLVSMSESRFFTWQMRARL